jgi:hypothetical protein
MTNPIQNLTMGNTPTDPVQCAAFTAWVDAALPNVYRMSADEAYRQEIALRSNSLAC